VAEGRIQGRRTGFVTIADPLQPRAHERETYGCGHCQHVTIVEHGQALDSLGGMCLACMRPLCRQCTSHAAQPLDKGGGCDPWEKKHERSEARQREIAAVTDFSTELERKIGAQLERARFLDQVESRDVWPSARF